MEKTTKELKAKAKAIREEFKAELLNEDSVLAVLDTVLLACTQFKGVSIEENVKFYTSNLIEIEKGKIQVGEEERQEIAKRTHKKYWEDQLKQKADYYSAIIDSAKTSRITERQEYIKLVNFITGSKRQTKKHQQTASELVQTYGGQLKEIEELYPSFAIYYLEELKDVSNEQAMSVIVLSAMTGELEKELDDMRNDLLEKVTDENAGYVIALADMRANVYDLTNTEKTGKKLYIVVDVEKENDKKSKIVPFKLPYVEYLTTAETEMLSVITSKNFVLDHKATKYSEQVINSLEKIDQEILDYITLTLYRNNYYYFTDRHIAVVMYKNKPTETVSDAMLKEINDSLARIQNVNLPVGYISDEISKNGKTAKLVRDSKLIWLDVVNYDYETKSTVYRIVDRPPYYDYANQTGRLNEYKREIITRDIKGIQHNTKNTTLKQRFIRNVLALRHFNDVTMPIHEVYNILAITDKRDYLKARKKAKSMLDDLKQNYNFEYEFKRKNGAVAGIRFMKYTDRPLEK